MTAARLPCVCGCPQGRHLMGKRDCRSCQTCAEYEPVAAGPEPVVLDVTALLGEVQDDADREAELAGQLAVTQSEIESWRGHSATQQTEIERLGSLLRERQTETETLRVLLTQAEQYARDLQDEGVVPDGAVVVLFAYEAWQCLDGSVNCSRRYFADDPDHGCGPLTPVTVTVSRRPA